jgi:hypothetical protein
MHFVLVGLLFVVQVSFAVHAFKTGRQNWAYPIMFIPAVGCAVYFFVEILPELRHNSATRTATSTVSRIVGPSNNLKRLQEQLELLDTVENRQLLAREYVRADQFGEAIDLYKSCLKGLYANDPQILLEMANVYFLDEQFAEAKGIFLRLREYNPEFRSPDGHLLFARTLENLGETDSALQEYEAVYRYYPGEEASARYAVFLAGLGRTEQAGVIFNQILLRDRRRKGRNRKREQPWVEIARQNSLAGAD